MWNRKVHSTLKGDITYWVNEKKEQETTLVFLPGLTADHRLFVQQASYFKEKYRILVWDAPGHGRSRPFDLTFSMADLADWLYEILCSEEIGRPVLIGQSMGGYVGQAFAEQYPDMPAGFIAIDSAPLQRKYVTAAEIWLLKRMEPVYQRYPWNALMKSGIHGTAVTDYGRKMIYHIWKDYKKEEFARLAGHGFRILAEAMEADLKYELKCPALLLCGEKDQAGSVKRYNRRWAKETGITLVWIPDAGHNSNADQPEMVNTEIEKFLGGL